MKTTKELTTGATEGKEAPSKSPFPFGLIESDLLGMYYHLLLSRLVDERMWSLNRQGKVPFTISCRGHEAAQVGTAYALRKGTDFVVPYYRDIGVVLVMGMTPRDLMLSLFAKAEDPSSGGRQMPNHFGHAALKIITGSSPVATQIPQAVGIALASKIKREEAVTIVYFGDGATSKGDFHEGLNFAGIHKLPIVFVCEDNGYAISVPHNRQMAIQDVADRAAGYGFPGVVVDGNDVLAVYGIAKEGIERARGGGGPTLIEAKTYRLMPHSSDDDDRRYRSQEEVEEWRRKDPILRFRSYLEGKAVLPEVREQEIRERVIREIDEAVAYAVNSPYPDPVGLFDNLYCV